MTLLDDSTTSMPSRARSAMSATARGGLAVLVSLVVLVLPALDPAALPWIATAGLVAVGATDLVYAATGRWRALAGRRWLAGVRGVALLGAATAVVLTHHTTLVLLVLLAGLVLVVRGAGLVAASALGRDGGRRVRRLVRGLASLGLGLVALASPRGLEAGFIALAALVTLVTGAIVLTSGIDAARRGDDDLAHQSVTDILLGWVRRADVGPERREAAVEPLYFERPRRADKQLAWWTMLVLSVAIATFAVLQDSTAVVIGAMLVAPLMVPILGLAAALVNGWTRRAVASLLQVLAGVAAAVALAAAMSAWLPVAGSFETNSQIASRVGPGLLDLLVAVAAGAAGAFAIVNERVSASIAGVAIAVALVPPLSVVGISLGAGRPHDAAGALLLFATNFVAITLSASAMFLLAGLVAPTTLRDGGARRVLWTIAPVGAAALFVLVPLFTTSEGLLHASEERRTAAGAVDAWLADTPDLVLDSVDVSDDAVTLRLTGPHAIPDIRGLREALEQALDRRVRVRVVRTPAVVTEIGPG